MAKSNFAFRAAVAAALAVAAFAPGASTALAGKSAAVRVDVGPLLASSGEPTAAWVASELPRAIARAQAEAGAPAAPISVRVDLVQLGPNSGGVGPAGSSPDQMVGDVTSGGVTRPLRATSSYYPAPQDNVMIEASNHARVSALVRVFAGWIARGY